MSHYNVREAAVIMFLMNQFDSVDDEYILKVDHTPILRGYGMTDTLRFELYDNVTDDYIILDIPNDESFHDEMIEQFGFDPFEGCNKGKIVLTEFEPFEIKNKTLELDFTNITDSESIGAIEYSVMETLLATEFEYYDVNYYFGFQNLNGKTVVKSQSLTNPSEYNYKFGNDITSEDNIEIDLPSYLKSSFGNKDKLALKFAEKSYDANTYVIDYTSIDKLSSNNFKEVWDELYDEDLVDSYVNGTDVYSDGELLLSVEKPSYKDYDGMVSIAYHKDFDASDNAVLDISKNDSVKALLSGMGITGVDYLSFLFKKLELKLTPFKGEEKIKTAFTAADSIKFRLDLDYQKYKDELKIYIDEKELTKDKDYTLSEGSIIVTLADKFTNELELGSHTFSAHVGDESLTTSFTISATDEKTDTKTATTKTANPKTLDNAFYMFGLLAASIGGIYIVCSKIRKSSENN